MVDFQRKIQSEKKSLKPQMFFLSSLEKMSRSDWDPINIRTGKWIQEQSFPDDQLKLKVLIFGQNQKPLIKWKQNKSK